MPAAINRNPSIQTMRIIVGITHLFASSTHCHSSVLSIGNVLLVVNSSELNSPSRPWATSLPPNASSRPDIRTASSTSLCFSHSKSILGPPQIERSIALLPFPKLKFLFQLVGTQTLSRRWHLDNSHSHPPSPPVLYSRVPAALACLGFVAPSTSPAHSSLSLFPPPTHPLF